jgi:SAM-dependent methyltransferase
MPHDTSSPDSAPGRSDHSDTGHEAGPAFGSRWWEHHYQQGSPSPFTEPSPYVTGELSDLSPGTALDAGCGTGSDAIWLAGRGWDVTAVDISPTAIARARDLASSQAPRVTARIAWVVGDLTSWMPPHAYDLVISQYVHPDAPLDQLIQRLAAAVIPGGTLLVVGHDHADSLSTARAPRDGSIAAADISDLLDSGRWTIEIAETRTRHVHHDTTRLTLVDLVIKARRRET